MKLLFNLLLLLHFKDILPMQPFLEDHIRYAANTVNIGNLEDAL